MKKISCSRCKLLIVGKPYKWHGGIFCDDCHKWIEKMQKEGFFTK